MDRTVVDGRCCGILIHCCSSRRYRAGCGARRRSGR